MPDSSWIHHISHEEPNRLHLYTHGGKHYVHDGVSKDTYEAMKKSGSLGGFFNNHIRKQHPGRAV